MVLRSIALIIVIQLAGCVDNTRVSKEDYLQDWVNASHNIRKEIRKLNYKIKRARSERIKA